MYNQRQILEQPNKFYLVDFSILQQRKSFYMFPNDDICNVKAAKNAAKRIFEKYIPDSSSQKNNTGLGSKQIQSLIKNAYSTININYNPSNQDVFSFMSVFGSGENGKIQLNKLQQLAVKYLCGQQIKPVNNQSIQNQNRYKENDTQLQKQTNIKANLKIQNEESLKKIKSLQTLTIDSTKFNIKNNPQISSNTQNNIKLKNQSYFLSPKVNPSKDCYFRKQNTQINTKQTQDMASDPMNTINSMNSTLHYKNDKQNKLNYSSIMNQANIIFNQARTKSQHKIGITRNEVKQVLIKSYKLFGKQKYNPNDEDVQIWMKLCDEKKNGVVEWVSYQNFMKRLTQRYNISQNRII